VCRVFNNAGLLEDGGTVRDIGGKGALQKTGPVNAIAGRSAHVEGVARRVCGSFNVGPSGGIALISLKEERLRSAEIACAERLVSAVGKRN